MIQLEKKVSVNMTDTLVVILVSDQTAQNVQFLKWYFRSDLQNIDLLFVSTGEMEKKEKSLCIKNALEYIVKYINEVKTISVKENSLADVRNQLVKLTDSWKHKNYVVNITGGTKLMSLATYEYFSSFVNSKIYYQPLAKDLQQIFPEQKDFEVKELLTLEEYMKAYGISFEYANECLKNYDYNKTVYSSVIKDCRDCIKPMVAMQNNSYFKNIFKRKDFIDFSQIPDENFKTPEGELIDKNQVLETISKFSFDVTHITHSQLRYITGGWFEEYVYQKTKSELKLDEKNIALNVRIKKAGDKNELDVAYLDSNNKLHVIECKSFLEGKEGGKVLDEALYKLQAIMKTKFGLNAVPHLFTQSVIEKESALNRAKEFGIQIIDGKSL